MAEQTIVYLRDGRSIDVSNLSPAAAVAKLHAAGVTVGDIDKTIWIIPTGSAPLLTRRRHEMN